MTTTNETAIEWVGARGEELSLTIAKTKELLGVPNARDWEVEFFLRFCASYQLNPLNREVHFISYDGNKPPSIVVGKDAFTQRAQSHPDFAGFRAGIIIQRNNKLVHEPGAFYLPGDRLLGGWFEGRRKSQAVPFFHQVSMQEYNPGHSTWKKMPGTMIRKVAIVQGLREMFPSLFTGMYDQAEMAQAGGGDVMPHEVTQALNEYNVTDIDAEISVPGIDVAFSDNDEELTLPPEVVDDAADTLDGGGWMYSDKYESWSRRNEGRFEKLGADFIVPWAVSVGIEHASLNAILKMRYGKTASKISPSEAQQLIKDHADGVDLGAAPKPQQESPSWRNEEDIYNDEENE